MGHDHVKPDAWPGPDTPARKILGRAVRSIAKEIGKAVILTAGCAILAVGVNALRGKARGGIDLVARAPYDIYTDCPEMESNLPQLPPSVVARWGKRLLILDARPARKYLAGHLPGARSLPMYGTQPHAPAGLDWLQGQWGRFVVVYGKDEVHSSARLATYLRQQGVGAVHLLQGDLEAWRAAGHTLERRPLTTITPEEARKAVDALFVDARPKAFFVEGHVPGALSLPFQGLAPPDGEVFAKLLAERRRLIIYGLEQEDEELADPGAPAEAKDVGRLLAAELVALGATRVLWLPGGLAAWTDLGGPLQSGAQKQGGTP